ncbi:MAG: hypothetical protein K2X35_12700 [Bryobacteraceae bacterium]|nr:hypothetical protein [Bryobacteraceae bacterium]
MNIPELITGSYQRNARFYPALVVLFPIATAVAAIIPTGSVSTLQTSFGLMFVSCGGLYLLGQLARDGGKKKEGALFDLWGGMPSVAVFRHSDQRVDPITKARYHKVMSALVKDTKPLSANEERIDPRAADQIYSAWSSYIRVSTRDTKKYSLIYQELASYGYRRNILGLRPVGIVTTGVLTVVTGWWNVDVLRSTGVVDQAKLLSGGVSLVFFLLWTLLFTPEWVRVAADAYAGRLVEAIDDLSNHSSSEPKKEL